MWQMLHFQNSSTSVRPLAIARETQTTGDPAVAQPWLRPSGGWTSKDSFIPIHSFILSVSPSPTVHPSTMGMSSFK